MLLGRNGAGKTTTLRTIMGLWQARAGAIRFRGGDIAALHTSDIARKGIAFVPENMGIFGGLTVEENMRLATHDGSFDKTRLEPRLCACSRRSKPSGPNPAWSLSGGQKQMLAIARAIIEKRDLILIDEPTKGLAPAIIVGMVDAFREIAQPKRRSCWSSRIFFCQIPRADDMAVIDDGRIAHCGTMADFVADKELQARLLSLSEVNQ